MANYRERLLTDSPTGPSFSTARRERSEDLSHIRETLNPGVPGPPCLASLDASGQWPVCRADASPTEDPCKSGELGSDCEPYPSISNLPPGSSFCQQQSARKVMKLPSFALNVLRNRSNLPP